MKPAVLVFDYGGVMTTCSTPFRVRTVVEREGLPWQPVVDAFSTFRRSYDLGDISLSQFYDRIWKEAGASPSQSVRDEIVHEDTESFLYRNERTLEWMGELKREGYRLAILTNMPPDLAVLFKSHFADFISLAEVTVISSEVHLVKPMREIYDLLRDRLGVRSEEICFFDDSDINCRGAEAAGWRTIRFSDVEQAAADLKRLQE